MDNEALERIEELEERIRQLESRQDYIERETDIPSYREAIFEQNVRNAFVSSSTDVDVSVESTPTRVTAIVENVASGRLDMAIRSLEEKDLWWEIDSVEDDTVSVFVSDEV